MRFSREVLPDIIIIIIIIIIVHYHSGLGVSIVCCGKGISLCHEFGLTVTYCYRCAQNITEPEAFFHIVIDLGHFNMSVVIILNVQVIYLSFFFLFLFQTTFLFPSTTGQERCFL
jgi:hypothetical protein